MSEIKTLSLDDLEDLREQLLDEIHDIKGQIEKAKSKAASAGEFADRDWYHKANHASRNKSRQYQKVVREISNRKKAERARSNNSPEKVFIQVAKRRLDEEVFADMWAEAKEICELNKEGEQGA